MENYRLLILAIVFLFVLPTFTNAYATSAHQELHKNILQEYQRLSGDNLEPVLRNFFIKGAVTEDTGARPINHFYDPINNVGLKNDTRPKSIIWATNPLLQANFGNWSLFRDKDTKLLEHEGDYSWQRAVYEYANGDKERAMQSLGHIMHLLEDLTSVPHTRDDAHSGSWFDGSSYYEDYTADKVPGVHLPVIKGDSDIETIFRNLSTYTNTHYLSADTVFQKYQKPKLDIQNIYNEYAYNESGSKLVLVEYKENKKGQRQLDKVVLNDPQVMQSYWDHLSYKAVESGVALMDLFFREVEKEKQTRELAYMNKSYREIKNLTKDSQIKMTSMSAAQWSGARKAAEYYGLYLPTYAIEEEMQPDTKQVATSEQRDPEQVPALIMQDEVAGALPPIEYEPSAVDIKTETEQLATALGALESLLHNFNNKTEKTVDICSGIDLSIIKVSTCLSPYEEGGFGYGGGGAAGSESSEASGGPDIPPPPFCEPWPACIGQQF